MEMTAEDLQYWTKAYKEDKGHVAAYMEIQKYEDFYLTPSKTNGKNNGGFDKKS